ncbi:MAG: hypothetical protein GPOALKHO_001547 [Sodalis sp.]|nr:MAG: hypothetical protein GPOALKHO_001547 [Sodalis sp.]
MPVINQIELYPLLQQQALRDFDAWHQILTESWSPLAKGGNGVFNRAIGRLEGGSAVAAVPHGRVALFAAG